MIFKHNKRYEKTLDNGMRLIYDYIPKSEITQIGCLINAGSIDELGIRVLPGTAHFIEHMVFNGSKKYTKEELTSIRENGGSVNAYTGSDSTCYYESFLTENLTENFSKFFSMIFEPAFTYDDIEKEREVIKNEKLRSKDDPFSVHFEVINKGFRNKSFRNSTLGTMESINKINYVDLKEFHNTFYRFNNSILYIQSSISLFKLENLLKTILSKIDFNRGLSIYVFNDRRMRNTNSYDYYYSKNKKTNFNTSIISFTYTFPKKEYYTLILLNEIYTEGIGSILWDEFRVKRSLCYQFFGYINYDRKDSEKLIYRICVMCSKNDFDKIKDVINKVFTDFDYIDKYITKEKVISAYKQKYYNLAMQKINPILNNFTDILEKANKGIIYDKAKAIKNLEKSANINIIRDFLLQFKTKKPYIVKTIEK